MKTSDDLPFGDLEPVWGFLLTALYIVGMPYFFYPPLMRMVDDVRLHGSGTVAKESHCRVFSYQGTRSSSWTLYVTYTAQDGTEHSPDVDTFMWWRKPDSTQPCTVHYDPASPDHVSTDWGFDRLFGRVIAYLILVPLPLFGEIIALRMMLAFLFGSARGSPSIMPIMPIMPSPATRPPQDVGWQGSGATTPPWQGYCGALIRRRNRRLFILSVVLLSIGSAMFWAYPASIWYWQGFFLGPRPVTGHELAAIDFSRKRAGWISVAADSSKDTGVDIYTTYSDGKRFREGRYVLADIDGYPLVIHVENLAATGPYRGTLEPLDRRLASQLQERGYASEGHSSKSAIAAFYLETIGQDSLVHYRKDGFDEFKLCFLFLLFGFPAFWLSLRRSIDKGRHPFARALAKRGSLAANVQQIDQEILVGARTIEKLRITSHWLILERYWAPIPRWVSEVVWVYAKRVKSGPACCIYFQGGDKMQVIMKSAKTAEDAATFIATLAPQAIRGYDAAVEKIWSSDVGATKFSSTVRSQFPQRNVGVGGAGRTSRGRASPT